MSVSRRSLLGTLALIPLAATGALAADGANSCYDPSALPASQRSRRRSLGFREQSGDPAKRCGTCAFFTSSSAGCGKCALLTGGPVTAQSVCNSWARKP